jgi:hypothetical protein
MNRIVLLILILLLLAAAGPELSAAKRVKLAYLEIEDHHTRFTGLSAQLKRIGRTGTDVSARVRDGRFKLSSCNVLLAGSFALSDQAIQRWFRREAEALRKFVGKGGVVIAFTQDGNDWDMEPWLPEAALVMRGGAHADSIRILDREHPLFNKPELLSAERINTFWKGDGKWKGGSPSWWSIEKVRSARVLAALSEKGPRPWCVETGWGEGRALFFSCAPDKVPPDQAKPTVSCCDAVLKNALNYASLAINGKAPPLPEDVMIADPEERIHLKDFSKEEKRAFTARVDEAVDRAVKWLLKKQGENGSWGSYTGPRKVKYEAGLTALALLALLNSGVNKFDPHIESGFAFLMDCTPAETYEIAFTLMALEMKAAPMFERFTLAKMGPDERKAHRFERTLSGEERVYMERLVERLVEHKDRGGCWRYSADLKEHDISNGQFAVLGLKSASRCGMKVDREIWEEVLEYYLTYQSPKGSKVKFKEFNSFEPDGTPKFRTVGAEARGWSYAYGFPEAGKIVGSHVNIGISCLLLSYEELAKLHSPAAGKNRAEVKQAVRDALAWLDAHWSVDVRPNSDKHYYHYYIYSLGRVGALTQRRFIGEHDWYREGACYLMDKQGIEGGWAPRSGSWGIDVASTSFTLLFLNRSTPPPVITVED